MGRFCFTVVTLFYTTICTIAVLPRVVNTDIWNLLIFWFIAK